ncbi:MAG: tagatose 1,6-diphosphate aldolase [Candidatus Kerfeldbacteria bacterium]|nr:tagatose 1,6-diphosphate aldolase [Candidatus Kerfeldbacteria bacterium]
MVTNLRKKKRLKELSDKKKIFRILALDHISSLKKFLLRMSGVDDVEDNTIIEIKKIVVKVLANEFSGILLDLDSYIKCNNQIPKDIGTLIKLEKDWQGRGKGARERITTIFSDSAIEQITRTGASGVKLMLYYRPDASKKIIEEQNKIAQQIGEQCEENNIVYCLEPMWYPLLDDELDGSENAEAVLAKRRPIFVLDSLREFAKPQYCVDLFKLEFPADLRFTKEYADGRFDGKNRESVYDIVTIEKWCREIDKLTNVPWTIMSSGVSNEQFLEFLRICRAGNVDGYICGQAIWKDALRGYPDFGTIEKNLMQESINNIHCINNEMDSHV